MRRFILGTALLLWLTDAFSPLPAAAVPGGPVILMGIDAEDGGEDGHGPVSLYADVVEAGLGVGPGQDILVVGGGKDPDDDVTTFWDAVAAETETTVTYVNGPDAIGEVSLDGFEAIAVVSSEPDTPDGGLTEDENDALLARAVDVATFVNGGGALLGFSQGGLANPYQYVFADLTVDSASYRAIAPTAEGAAVGITDDDLDLCCWHQVFLAYPAAFDVLATHDDEGRGGFGEAAAIGGEEVTLPVPTCVGLPATIVGTDDDDDLVGTPERDVIVAGSGDDAIDAGDGNDLVCAGRGDDDVLGDDGDDRLRGGPGHDELSGGEGEDILRGFSGQDILSGGAGKDRLLGGLGKDRLSGDDADDLLHGGPSRDFCDGGAHDEGDAAVACETVVNVP